MLRLGPFARVGFAVLWVAGQGALVLSAPLRPDRSFGFDMFAEASTMEVYLEREVDGRLVAARDGEWISRDRFGQPNRFSWRDRVHDPVLSAVDKRVFASYGIDAQLERLQRALNDVVNHIPDDTQTARLVASVVVWRNGREPTTVTLYSNARRGFR